MPNLFSYSNYRTFLKDAYEEKRKTANPQFSYRLFSRLAGFSSPNFIKLVMMGQRNLSTDGVAKVAKALELKVRETRFFEALVSFGQAQTREDKSQSYTQLLHFKAFKDVKGFRGWEF